MRRGASRRMSLPQSAFRLKLSALVAGLADRFGRGREHGIDGLARFHLKQAPGEFAAEFIPRQIHVGNSITALKRGEVGREGARSSLPSGRVASDDVMIWLAFNRQPSQASTSGWCAMNWPPRRCSLWQTCLRKTCGCGTLAQGHFSDCGQGEHWRGAAAGDNFTRFGGLAVLTDCLPEH
jgi:hypothetical protein